MTTSSPNELATQTICFAAPLLPGTTSIDREEMLSCWTGERRDEHTTSRRQHGITREAVWIQPTPGGDFAVVLLEAADLGNAMLGMATLQKPFDTWFREHLKTVHGMDLSQGVTLPETVLDYRT